MRPPLPPAPVPSRCPLLLHTRSWPPCCLLALARLQGFLEDMDLTIALHRALLTGKEQRRQGMTLLKKQQVRPVVPRPQCIPASGVFSLPAALCLVHQAHSIRPDRSLPLAVSRSFCCTPLAAPQGLVLFLRFMLAKLSCLHVVMLMDAPLSNALLEAVSACIGKDGKSSCCQQFPPTHLTPHPSTPPTSLPHPP